MKRFVALLLAATLCIGLMAGCSFTLPGTTSESGSELDELNDALKELQDELQNLEDQMSGAANDDGDEPSADEPSEMPSSEPSADVDENDKPEEEMTEEPSDEPSDEPEDEDTFVDEDKSNITISDITTVDATREDPAKLGEWIQVYDYSVETSKREPLFFRLTDVKRGVQDEVDKYNASLDEEWRDWYEVPDLTDDALEYCSLTYEVYYPENYPISKYDAEFDNDIISNYWLTSVEGGGIESGDFIYIGLYIEDVSADADITEGDTVMEGTVFFAMLKGETDYLVEISDADNDNKTLEYYYDVE